MTSILLLLLLFWLSVAAEKSYVPVLKSIGMDDNAKKLLDFSNMTIIKNDDNTIVLDGSVRLTQDLINETTVTILGKQKQRDGSGYQTQASFNYTTGICNFIANDTVVYPDILQCSNYPPDCPVIAGLFTMDQCLIGNQFPDEVPGDHWRFEVHILQKIDGTLKEISQNFIDITFDRMAAKQNSNN